MSAAPAVEEAPQLLHALPGRVRVHLPAWSGQGQRTLEGELRRIEGVRSARANGLTGNVLIQFDPALVDDRTLLGALGRLAPRLRGDAADEPAPAPAPARHAAPLALTERTGGPTQRARIAMRGLDRDPALARRVVDRLAAQAGVQRVSASPLTGRVLVEFSAHQVELQELLAQVADLELPALPDEDRPSHPLDPAPLIQSLTRTAGAALGLALLAGRRLANRAAPPVGGAAPAVVADVLGLLRSFPVTRDGLRRLLGANLADLVFGAAGVLSLALSGNPLGLALNAAEGLRLLTEVRARRAAWQRYAERLAGVAAAEPGAVIRLEAGERTSLAATVLEGTGTVVGHDGLPVAVAPGDHIPAGGRLSGGPFVLELRGDAPFAPEPRPAPAAKGLYERYLQALGPASLAYAALTALATRSLARTFEALLLVNPRAAVIGAEGANTGAAARVLRAGVTVVGTRPERVVRRPDLLLLEGPRLLAEGLEVGNVLPLTERLDAATILAQAAGVAAAAGSPWGPAFPGAGHAPADEGRFDGRAATASIGKARYTLGPAEDWPDLPAATRLQYRGTALLLLRRGGRPLGLLALRPRLAPGVADLVAACRRRRVDLALLTAGDPLAARAVAGRAGVPLLPEDDGRAVEVIRARQATGEVVTFLADSARAAPAFAACDLAIGLTAGRTSRFPARADLLAPDLAAVAAIVEAGARREAGVRDAVLLSLVANAVGAVWGLRGRPGVVRSSQAVYIAALAALADGWARLRGGERPGAAVARLVDPRPERWGRRSRAGVLRELRTGEHGLSGAEAAARRQAAPRAARRNGLLTVLADQVRSPIIGILAAGAGLSLALGAVADVLLIGATIAANVAVGAWQERKAGQAAEALAQLGTATARVLRDGQPVTVPAGEVVPGDVLVLAAGDRVAADARVLGARGLEVDEAALTGESLPVAKGPSGGAEASRVVLEGSDVTAGTGRAVAVAVGRQTRWGATAAALERDEPPPNPLGQRLSRMLRLILPLAAGGGALIVAAGLLRGRPPLQQLVIGASVAVAAVPEGLPLLAGMGEAAVARRLAGRSALVRRLAAVEALGRVDVACTDKTGTLTEGRLALRLVADVEREADPAEALPADLRRVLQTAALASPHPDAADARSHPTDVAVVRGAREAGLRLQVEREAELPFDPARAFHATIAQGRLRVKGAAEVLAPRCDRVRRGGEDLPLDAAGREALLARAQELAGRGLRLLMVAEGRADGPVDDPQGLVALGFLGISDPLRPGVRAAVRRCHDAGIRVVMLTGDHPATARAIAREAGLLDRDGSGRESPSGDGGAVITGDELAGLDNGALDQRLERATVLARITPLDKVRIVESLQRRGHTVAMTGDGVNDAPALRLADVGVAMGRGGTEVARQAADVVLADDNFATLVETLVEGRSFWRNIRRALGLLLGGNLGELGFMVGASVLGLASALTARQVLAVNLITDALPALAVALQQPEHRNLAGLAREGTAALDAPLRDDVLRRGIATAAPTLAAYLLALRSGAGPEARTIGFASIVATQLAQTLELGRTDGGVSGGVLGAVAGSAALLVAALTAPPLRAFLGLVMPGPAGWLLIGATAPVAVALSRLLWPSERPAPRALAAAPA